MCIRDRYKNKQGGIWCDHWSSCCNVLCECWMAWSHPIAYWLSILDLSGGINQMTVFEIITAVLRCSLDCVLAYYALSCKCTVNWVCAWRTVHTWHVYDIVGSLGAAMIARSPIPRSISRYRLIDMNPSPKHCYMPPAFGMLQLVTFNSLTKKWISVWQRNFILRSKNVHFH